MPPYFLRYSINSAAIKFKNAEDFPDPKPMLEAKWEVKLDRRRRYKVDNMIREPLDPKLERE